MPATSREEIQRIGFFHFGTRYSQPTAELEASLLETQRKRELKNSLRVLPEGFNIGVNYSDVAASIADSREVLLHLSTIASRFSVALVAGLIVRESGRPSQPYNSAFLIDGGSEPILICRKRNQDNAIGRYKVCHENYDIENPTTYRNCSVAVLICMDAFQQDGEDVQRHMRLASGMRKKDFGVLCIPAHMYRDNEGVAQGWGENWVVLANSNANRPRGSYIARGGVIDHNFTAEGQVNQIVLKDL